ncbi:hypothetical protein KCU71_g1139, partial [Aureobasidium melanogenum]
MHDQQLVQKIVDTQAVFPWLLENGRTEKLETLSRPQRIIERQRLLHALSPQQREQYKRQGMDPVVNQPGEILLTSGTSIDAKDETHAMSLHSAIKGGHKEIIPLLLDRGADVNTRSERYDMPLHIASFKGYKEIIQLLLDRGADVNAKDETHSTPLHVASYAGHKEIAQLLLDRGADVNAKDKTHYTPLYEASFKGYKEIIQLLLDRGANVNAKDKTHSTPLYVASIQGHKEIVQLLLDNGADDIYGHKGSVVDFSRSHSGESKSGIHGSRRGHTRTTFSIDHTA